MKIENFTVGEEKLVGQFVGEDPSVLFLHGAGISHRKRSQLIAEKLAEHGVGSFSFDFSGWGESTGTIAESSLKKRVEQAEAALKFLTKKPYTLIGSSMGAHIALELIKNHDDIANLVLLCPGIYTKEAFNVPFDEKFSNIIRQPESWKNNDVMSALNKFNGNVLVIIGENDEVIPSGVIEMISENLTNSKSKEVLVLPGINHQLIPSIVADEELLTDISNRVAESIE